MLAQCHNRVAGGDGHRIVGVAPRLLHDGSVKITKKKAKGSSEGLSVEHLFLSCRGKL